jgi:hypothetical protein
VCGRGPATSASGIGDPSSGRQPYNMRLYAVSSAAGACWRVGR